MPDYAFLEATVNCPFCQATITDEVTFQWGYCPGAVPKKGFVYHIGDPVYWRECRENYIPPWSYFEDWGGNLGDPKYRNLIVKDSGSSAEPCRFCRKIFGGLAVEIKNNMIERAWIFLLDEIDENAEIFVVEENGEVKPMPEWNDYPMKVIKDC